MDRLDIDFQPLRSRLYYSALCRIALKSLPLKTHTLLINTQNSGLLIHDKKRTVILCCDATNKQLLTIAHHGRNSSCSPLTWAPIFALEKRAFLEANYIVAWSKWAKRSLIEDYHVPQHKIIQINPGIDSDFFCPNNKSDQYTFKVMFSGGDFIRKGGDILINAYQTVYKKGWELHLATNTNTKSDPAKGIFNHGYINSTEKLRHLYRSSDCLALPTKSDCSPIAILEAMGCGLPIITTHVGAIPEIVRHGREGLLVERKVSEVSAALLRLANDFDKRIEYSCNSRKRAVDNYNIANTAKSLLKLVHNPKFYFSH